MLWAVIVVLVVLWLIRFVAQIGGGFIRSCLPQPEVKSQRTTPIRPEWFVPY